MENLNMKKSFETIVKIQLIMQMLYNENLISEDENLWEDLFNMVLSIANNNSLDEINELFEEHKKMLNIVKFKRDNIDVALYEIEFKLIIIRIRLKNKKINN